MQVDYQLALSAMPAAARRHPSPRAPAAHRRARRHHACAAARRGLKLMAREGRTRSRCAASWWRPVPTTPPRCTTLRQPRGPGGRDHRDAAALLEAAILRGPGSAARTPHGVRDIMEAAFGPMIEMLQTPAFGRDAVCFIGRPGWLRRGGQRLSASWHRSCWPRGRGARGAVAARLRETSSNRYPQHERRCIRHLLPQLPQASPSA